MDLTFRRDEVAAAIGMAIGRLGLGKGQWYDASVITEWALEFVMIFKDKAVSTEQFVVAVAKFTKMKVAKLNKGESLLEVAA